MSTLTSLISFDYNGNPSGSGSYPAFGALIADAQGDMFGTAQYGGAIGYGTVIEIAKTSTGYASTPTVLFSFDNTNGAFPYASLIADAQGDLFGTTTRGGANGYGTVFEIAKTSTGYASTPTVLASFDYSHDGAYPQAGLLGDAQGNLFGTTQLGGAIGYGTVFEIAKTSTGYASTPTVLFSFDNTNGGYPIAGLIADGQGNLFGTTEQGGANGTGTVFEIIDSGFVVPVPIMLNALYNPLAKLTTLSGTAEANSSVSVFEGTKVIGTSTAAADGTWSLNANLAGTVIHSFTETATLGNTISSAGVTLYSQAKHALQGGTGDDVLVGRPNDTLTGGGGADTFVFNPNLGKETITDFGANLKQNVIAFDKTLFANPTASQVLSQTHDTKAGAVIVVDAHDTVTLTGVSVTQCKVTLEKSISSNH